MIRLYRINAEQGGWSLSVLASGLPAEEQGETVQLPQPGTSGVVHVASLREDIVPPLAYVQHAEPLQCIQLRENTEYEFCIRMPLTREVFEDSRGRRKGFPFTDSAISPFLSFNGPDSWVVEGDGRLRVTGRLNFRHAVGLAHLDMRTDAGVLAFPLEVVTYKLDYCAEFRVLLQDLANVSAALALRLDAATESVLHAIDPDEVPPLVEILHYRRLFDPANLPLAVTTLLRNPAYRHRAVLTKQPAAFTVSPDWSYVQAAASEFDYQKGGPLRDRFGGYTPTTLPERSVCTDFDTDENRFVKYLLQELSNRLGILQSRLPSVYVSSHEAVKAWLEELKGLLEDPFWLRIGECTRYPNSMLLIQRRGYRDVVQLINECQLGIALDSSDSLTHLHGGIRPVYDLYEVWCFLEIHRIITQISEEPGDPLLGYRFERSGFSGSLNCSGNSPVTFTYRDGTGRQCVLRLHYKKQFEAVSAVSDLWHGSYSGPFTPDISVQVEVDGRAHWLHFDAKYRLSVTQWQQEVAVDDAGDQDGEVLGTYKRSDLHKMHTYRDALLGTRGSYVLFPGSSAVRDIYVRHGERAFRASSLVPSVGVFALRPGRDDLHEEQVASIRNFLGAALNTLAATGTYREEYAHVSG